MTPSLRFLLAFVGVTASVALADWKEALAIAPPTIVTDADRPQAGAISRALAEVLSWEASAIPGLRLVDPSQVRKSWVERERRSIGEVELEEGRNVLRQSSVSSVLLLQLERRGGVIEGEAVLVHKTDSGEGILRVPLQTRPQGLLPALRKAAMATLDSVGVKLPAGARALLEKGGRDSWNAMSSFGQGLIALEEKRKTDALPLFREAARLDPDIPAVQLRLRQLERELQPGR